MFTSVYIYIYIHIHGPSLCTYTRTCTARTDNVLPSEHTLDPLKQSRSAGVVAVQDELGGRLGLERHESCILYDMI